MEEGREGGRGACAVVGARRAKGKPLPAVEFVEGGVEAGRGKRRAQAAAGRRAKPAQTRALCRLLQGVYRRLPHHVRAAVVGYV
jgi:hypothetical protein